MKHLFLSLISKLKNSRFLLLIPFGILSLVLVIIPLIIVIFYALSPVENYSVNVNFQVFNTTTLQAIWRSLWTSILTAVICLVIAYPFSYFLSFHKSKLFKTLIILIVTAPIWSSFLIKLIGLKTILDILNGGSNSTFGLGYNLLGLIYLYLPFAILPIYNVLNQMPRNIVYASQDLGYNPFSTFWLIVIPYTKAAMMSGVIMVFLPSFSTVAVGQFLNNNNGQPTIGDINYAQGLQGLDSPIALARASAISLVISLIMFFCYGLIVLVPKIFKIINARNFKLSFKKEFYFLSKIIFKLKNFLIKNQEAKLKKDSYA